MEDSSILSFRKRLLGNICTNWNEKSLQLIRKHDKNLEKGDFSFPNFDNNKVWENLDVINTNLNELTSSCPEICTMEESRGFIIIHLDRKFMFQELFLKPQDIGKPTKKSSAIVNFDEAKPNVSNLTTERTSRFCKVLPNLKLSKYSIYGVSSTDTTLQLENYESDLMKVPVRVGVILGDDDKKDVSMDFKSFEADVYDTIKVLDDERCDENEDAASRCRRLSKLTFASIQFSFLGSNISNPTKIMKSNPNSNFVLYNSARIKRLLSTFNQSVEMGTYPPLPLVDSLDFGNLNEVEEWELLFNFILPFPDVLLECSRLLSFHKLVNFLVNMASVYSRYYNRIKTLKDPLPHLVPVIHARIYFLKEVNKIFDNSLMILNIDSLGSM